MSDATEKLYQLLPSVYRIRDTEHEEALRALLAVIAEQAQVVEEDIARLYDNWFIETCDEWVAPYIGDLLSVRGLHPVSKATFSQRAQVANTLGYRRRKGTATMLELLARDTTGWNARVVEFFELLGTTQHFNHIRLHNHRTPDLRKGDMLDLLDTPFDSIAHTADVRHIDNNRGKHNIPNVGIFLWRLQAYPVNDAPAFSHGDRRYSFSQLGNDIPLFNHPVTEESPSQLAREINVPTPIRRRAFHDRPQEYYGNNLSILVSVGGAEKSVNEIVPCNLGEWKHSPDAGKVAIDPVLGRIVLADDAPEDAVVQVSYYYGFSSEVGGGFYPRELPPDASQPPVFTIAKSTARDTIQKAINDWGTSLSRPSAIFEIADSEVYEETLNITIPAGRTLQIRSSDEERPLLRLTAPMSITGESPAQPDGPRAQLVLDGLLISGNGIQVLTGDLGSLEIRHCTLVPGLDLDADSIPQSPNQPSLRVTARNTLLQVRIERSITGRLHLRGTAHLELHESIVDGLSGTAISGPTTLIESSTIFGPVEVLAIELASNSIFTEVVKAERRQEGCARFSFIPLGSSVPRRYRCQPNLAIATKIEAERKKNPLLTQAEEDQIASEISAWLRPGFTDRRYSQPGYAQLRLTTPTEVRTGAEDEAEMGVFRHLQQPQREANLRASLDEYLRFGLEAGILFVT